MTTKSRINPTDEGRDKVNSLFQAVRRTGVIFSDIAMTLSNRERQEMMTAKYAQSPSWLRNLFSWNFSEKNRHLKASENYRGLRPVNTGQVLPLHHFDIIWRGKEVA